jgi:DDE superfamily endonuclease
MTSLSTSYNRCGTTRATRANVFCAVEPKGGIYINKVAKSRDDLEFSNFMTELAQRYESAEKITLVMDNLSTHNREVLQAQLGEEAGVTAMPVGLADHRSHRHSTSHQQQVGRVLAVGSRTMRNYTILHHDVLATFGFNRFRPRSNPLVLLRHDHEILTVLEYKRKLIGIFPENNPGDR